MPPDMTTIYVCDYDEDSPVQVLTEAPPRAKTFNLRDVIEIRRGTSLDPETDNFCGTKTIRKNCRPVRYAYCVSFITSDR